MRVDLGLQRLELHLGGKLGLPVEIGEVELGREQPRKALGHRQLGLVQEAVRGVVELQRADGLAALLERHHDGSAQAAQRLRAAYVFAVVQDARGVVVDGLHGCARDDGTADEVVLLPHSGKAENDLAVGDRHRGRLRLAQRDAADLASGLLVEAATQVADRLVGDLEHAVGLQRSHVVGTRDHPHVGADEGHADQPDDRDGAHVARDAARELAGDRDRPEHDHHAEHEQVEPVLPANRRKGPT